MGIVERPGDLRPQPADRFGPARRRPARSAATIRSAAIRPAAPSDSSIASKSSLARPLFRRASAARAGSPPAACRRRCTACRAGAACGPATARWSIDADDVIVVELGQRLRLGAAVGRHLEGDEPLHRPLPGEKHLGEGPAAQLDEQVEVVDRVARLDVGQLPLFVALVERRGLVRLSSPRIEAISAACPGKASQVFLGRNVLAALLADVELFVDQVAGNVAVLPAREIRPDTRPAAWGSRG